MKPCAILSGFKRKTAICAVFSIRPARLQGKGRRTLALRRENEVLRAKFRDLAQRPFAKNTAEEDNARLRMHQRSGNSRKKEALQKDISARHAKPARPPDRTVLFTLNNVRIVARTTSLRVKTFEDHYQEDIVIARSP